MLKTVRVSEASWRVMKEHSKDLKVWREELRTIAGSRTRKAEPPPESSGDLEEGVIRGKLCHCQCVGLMTTNAFNLITSVCSAMISYIQYKSSTLFLQIISLHFASFYLIAVCQSVFLFLINEYNI